MSTETIRAIWVLGVIVTFVSLALLQRRYPKHDRDGAFETIVTAILWPAALGVGIVAICCAAVGWTYNKLSGAHHDS